MTPTPIDTATPSPGSQSAAPPEPTFRTVYEISGNGDTILRVVAGADGDAAYIEWTQPPAVATPDGGNHQVIRLDWRLSDIALYLDGTTNGLKAVLTLLGQRHEVLCRDGVLHDATTDQPIVMDDDSPLRPLPFSGPPLGGVTDRADMADVLNGWMNCMAAYGGGAASIGGLTGALIGSPGGLPGIVTGGTTGAVLGGAIGTGFGLGYCTTTAALGGFDRPSPLGPRGDRDLDLGATIARNLETDRFKPIIPPHLAASSTQSSGANGSGNGSGPSNGAPNVFQVDLRGLDLPVDARDAIATAVKQAALTEIAKLDIAPNYVISPVNSAGGRLDWPVGTAGLVAHVPSGPGTMKPL